MSRPKVSVFMVTYNHEPFIAQAIESVVMQKTDFTFELIIAEDCSTDRTREIALDYQSKYPHIIKVKQNERNIGGMKNFTQVFQLCSGEYIALLDGDDYWTSDKKLAEQVKYLSQNEDCSICWHPMIVLHEDGSQEPIVSHQYSKYKNEKKSVNFLIYSNFMHTSSIMFKNGLVSEFPEWVYDLPMCDYPLNLLLSRHGLIGCVDRVMGTYRIHSGGVWSSTKIDKRVYHIEKFAEMLLAFNRFTKYEFDRDIQLSIFKKTMTMEFFSEDLSSDLKSRLKQINQFSIINWKFNDRVKNRNVALFGTGEAARKVYQFLQAINQPVLFCVDNNPKNWGKTFGDKIPILSPEALHTEKCFVFVASMYYQEISEQLQGMGLTENDDYIHSELVSEVLDYCGSGNLRQNNLEMMLTDYLRLRSGDEE